MRKDAVIFLLEAVVLIAASLWLANRDGRMNERTRDEPAGPDGVRTISPQEANRRLKLGGKVVLLDVRTPEEYAEGRIPASVLLPLEPEDKITGGIAKIVPDKSTPIIVYCRSGRRSKVAAELLAKLGYTNVYDLGGINRWPYAKEKG